MKKVLVFLTLTVVLLMCLVSCFEQPEHTHNFGEWSTTKNPTCTDDGVKTRYCPCGEKQSDVIPATGVDNNEDIDDVITIVDGYLVINGVKTEYKVYSDPVISVIDGYVAVNGVKTEHEVNKADVVTVVEGYLVVNDVRTEHKVYSDPVVSVIDGYVAVNGVKTEYPVALACSHLWETVTTKSTCTLGGYDTMTCLLCDKSVKLNETAKLDHTYRSSYSFDDNYHWFSCTGCNAAKDKVAHTANSYNNCTVCGTPLSATPGVIYDISADGTYAEVIGYNGTATKIKIAEEYKGLPVKTIYKEAFRDNQNITSVVIPDSVTTIGNLAFCGCSNLSSVVLGKNVETIEAQAFLATGLETIHLPKSAVNIAIDSHSIFGNEITSITVDEEHPLYTSYNGDLYSKDKTILIKYAVGKKDTVVTIPDNVKVIGESAFESAWIIQTMIIPEGVTSIGNHAFNSCVNLTNVILPNSLTKIDYSAFLNCHDLIYNEYENGLYLGNIQNPYLALVGVDNNSYTSYKIHENTKIISGAFDGCSRLASIVIPKGVVSLGGYSTFYGCSNLTNIYFAGSKSEWDAIEKGYIGGNLTIHYNYNP